jgi:nucleoside phosphorylase/CheY-like chemotaxis protein
MNVLVLEDQSDKFDLLKSEVASSFNQTAISVVRAETFATATKLIYEARFDLIIIDLMMPFRDNEDPQDISEDVISVLELSTLNGGASIIALSGFDALVQSQRQRFAEAGIILVHYDAVDDQWKRHISTALARIKEQTVFDFVIVCALEKERTAYKTTAATIGELRNIRGLDCLTLQMGSLRGVCIKLPRMGLVEASIVTTRAIELFKPRVIAMSGICAGVAGNSKLGTLVLADMCWEYQAGKWSETGFKIEHYDVPISAEVRTTLSQIIALDPKGTRYKENLIEDPIVFESIIVAPMSTGSAVVASAERMQDIGAQHRKMAALDMEMYGVYKAAELSSGNPLFFGAKTVVDLADSAKGDTYHEYGSILSARFVLDAISMVCEGP